MGILEKLTDTIRATLRFIKTATPNNIIAAIEKRQQDEEAKVIYMMGSYPIYLSEEDISKVKCLCRSIAKKSIRPYLYWMNYILEELLRSVLYGTSAHEILKKFVD